MNNKDNITKIGTDWKRLDDIYDTEIQRLIDAADSSQITPEKLRELKKMQKELYELEVNLFEALQQKFS